MPKLRSKKVKTRTKKTRPSVKKAKPKPIAEAPEPKIVKTNLKKSELKAYRLLLLERRKELMEEMGELMKEQVSSTPRDTSGDLSSHAFHMADQGTDAMEREMAFMFASKSGRLVYHIDEALRRIEEGTFGMCLQCKKPISTSRLQAVPHARLCIKCKESEEGRRSAGK
jgi:RNA polymerase-binding protein DksA